MPCQTHTIYPDFSCCAVSSFNHRFLFKDDTNLRDYSIDQCTRLMHGCPIQLTLTRRKIATSPLFAITGFIFFQTSYKHHPRRRSVLVNLLSSNVRRLLETFPSLRMESGPIQPQNIFTLSKNEFLVCKYISLF